MKIRDLSLWEAFYWVAKDKNFTRAAARLKISPPQLSKRVSALEDELGVRLLNRTTRQVSLTQDGQGLLPHLESMLEDLQGLETRFESSDRIEGTIRLTCVTALAHRVLAPLIAEFMKLHPDVQFEIDPTDQMVDLIDQQMDLGIRVEVPHGADFVFIKLLENRIILCASPEYLRRHSRPPRSVQDLLQHSILTLKVYENCRFLKTDLRIGDLQPAQKLRCESGLFLTQMTLDGAGIAVRSEWDVRPLVDSGKLVQVLPRQKIESFGHVYAVIPNRRLLARRVRVFIDFLTERMRESGKE